MTSLSFEEVFGYYTKPQNDCQKTKLEVQCPNQPESSNIYQKLIDICADPQSLLDLLNIQIMNHVRSGSPDHFSSYEMCQMLNPFFSILPYVLSDRCIIAQAHQILINVQNFLSPWQYFSFQCFYKYFNHILSSKNYICESRKWMITTIFDLLSQNKKVYSHSIVTRVHLKDKLYKDKPFLHAVIHSNQTISIYSQNTCIKKGILKYEPDSELPTHQVLEMNDNKETGVKSRVVILDSNGEKITSDSAEQFFNEGYQIYHLIWSCMSCKFSDFSFDAIDAIVKMIFDFKGVFLQIFYYSKPIDGLFASLFKASIFVHRHTFVLKTLIWAIFDEAIEKKKIFKSSFPAVQYLICFMKEITKKQRDFLIQQTISYIDIYECNLEDTSSVNDPLEDDEFKHGIIQNFWDSLNEASLTFPKSFFDICYHLMICTYIHSKDPCQNRFSLLKDLLFGEMIIPHLIENLKLLNHKIYKDCFNFVTKSVTMTIASNKQDEYSLQGFEPLQKFLEFISLDTSKLNIKDIDMPSIREFYDAVCNLIDCIKGSTDYIRNCLPKNNLDFTSPSSFVDMPDINNESQSQLPVLRKTRSLKIHLANNVKVNSEVIVNHFSPYKDIPQKIFPWKSRIAKDVFYSYYMQTQDCQ